MPSTPPLLFAPPAAGLAQQSNGRAFGFVFALGFAVVLALLPLANAHADEAAEVRGLMARGDLPGALQRAEKASTAKPRDAQARFLVGVVLMEMQRDSQALALFASMAQEYPELPDPHNNMALLHARAGRLEAARQALETALRNDPAHRAARANLGQIYLMLAVQAWEQAASNGPIDPPLQRKLEGARALLASPTLAAR
jgi:tetratricopeptide (TPR) repeat protein